MKLSVAIITFNEERNIERCLLSVKEIADEIVVVDSFSKDRTRGICETHGAKFLEHVFEGHIQQKNYALSLCKGDWILSLDADEALDES
jgi:glycosyltransferase involved in cell wall biosynthesis